MKKILYIGDSHIIHCFSTSLNNSWYLVDVTLNKIRIFDSDLKVKHIEYREDDLSECYSLDIDGENISDLINNLNYESVLFSIGEIDVRYHLIKQLELNENAIDDILIIYNNFLKKIKSKIIICSIIPPGIDNTNEYTRNIEKRSHITIEINNKLKDMCSLNGYYFFDLYSDFNTNGILDFNKSDEGVHINKRFKDKIISNLI